MANILNPADQFRKRISGRCIQTLKQKVDIFEKCADQ